MVTVLQFTENLTTGSRGCGAGPLDWKYCLGLPLDDEGFDFSVLSEFRARLVARDLEGRSWTAAGPAERAGPGQRRGRQRTDSTHVLAAIRGLNRLELAGETVRAALEALAAAIPDWLAGVIGAPGSRCTGAIDNLHLPASETARVKLAEQYGRDGYHLLRRCMRRAHRLGAGAAAVQALR